MRRGFFRLWIVLSAVWVVLVFAIAPPLKPFWDVPSAIMQGWTAQKELRGSIEAVSLAKAEAVEMARKASATRLPWEEYKQAAPINSFTFEKLLRSIGPEVRVSPTVRVSPEDNFEVEFPDGSTAEFSGISEEMLKDALELVRVPAQRLAETEAKIKRGQAVTWSLSTALIPPFVAFTLGAALSWAFAGFRRRPS